MGIFASRDVQKDEELTFNYNVDRYGCVALSSGCSFRQSDLWFLLVDMMHSLVIVVNPNVLDLLVGRPRQILAQWTTSILTVRFHFPIPFLFFSSV